MTSPEGGEMVGLIPVLSFKVLNDLPIKVQGFHLLFNKNSGY
jgi:hypothetical protein